MSVTEKWLEDGRDAAERSDVGVAGGITSTSNVIVTKVSALDPRWKPSAEGAEIPTLAGQRADPPPPVEPKRTTGLKPGKRRFPVTSHWVGVVEAVTEGGFGGWITSEVTGDAAGWGKEYMEFSFEDLEYTSERPLVDVGSIFYWTIGRRSSEVGQITNQSIIRLRRVPAANTLALQNSYDLADWILADGSDEDDQRDA